MVYYFAYGGNLSLEELSGRVGRNLKPLFAAYLPNSKLAFPRESTYQRGGTAGYVPCKGKKLWGAVFLLSREEIEEKLDMHEGYYKKNERGSAYTKMEVKIMREEGRELSAITYVANKTGNFHPSKYYLDKIIKGAKECKLPKEYIEELKKIKMEELKAD
ncbi:MAG: gamma-glutamylcyclotransferase [Candidatus Diapherotrites archaeon]|nr:gamma-glutamylcyclotransferase [Candidatus Diapherotrites archaeon]